MGGLMAQWSLDRTSNDLIGVARGVLEAATTDNVQALALLACESFGASVAMSAESCYKAYLLCNRSHESAVLSFLKAQIGYRKGDCGWQLAQSDAGLRFLGLAACLNTIGSWNAAIVLHELIYTTATDKKLVPTSQHLKQLIQAVEDRLATSGFAESALGWAIMLSNETETSEDVQSPQLLIGEKHCTMAPPAKAVVGLTKAMSRLARVGEEVQRIEIVTTVDHAAWLVAFVKWSLGAPPAIVLYNGRTLGPETDLRVILRLVKNTGKAQEVRVDIYDYTGKIKDFVRDVPSLAEFRGLVGVRIYGETMLRRLFRHPHDPKYRACLQALPYACVLVRQNLVIRNEWSTAKISTADLGQWVGPETRLTMGQVFPSVEKISHVLHDYVGSSREEAPPHLTEISSVGTIEGLSLVSLVKSRMDEVCTCRSCRNTSTKANTYCKFKRFLSDVSRCAAHVLAISLLNPADPGGVQICFGSEISGPFLQCIQSILSGNKPPECSVSDVLEIAVQMVGHDLSDKHAWVMSSRYDQTVFPQMLSTQTIQSEGILSLECIPGILMWDGLRYNTVLVSSLYRQWDFDDEDPNMEITAQEGILYQQVKLEDGVAVYPKDSFSGLKLEWQVGLKETDVEVALLIPKFATLPGRNPRYVLDSAAESLFVNCTHDRMARFTPHTGNIYTTQPLDPRPQSRDPNSIGIVQCDKNEQIRFFTLATGRPGIIRLNSCLECCVKCCHLLASRFIVC
jgi:hypothetical protein